ncbi:MAG: FAD binding domain-containing protein [Saprospiraceae bacterium]
MIATAFDYKKASSVAEAISMLQSAEDGKILAGGHSLVPAMKLRLNSPDTLIDISKISGLRYIKDEGDRITIGANATHGEIANSDAIQSAIPMVAQAASMIGDPQVRNRGTIGGSLAHADPAADWPALMLAADATFHLEGPNGERHVSASDFFTGFYETALGENELITSIHLPKPTAGSVSTYQKFVQPASRFAIVGCAIQLTLDGSTIQDARVAFSGLSEYAFRDGASEAALKGCPLNDATINSVMSNAGKADFVLSDHFASEEYRSHLARVYFKRAMQHLAEGNTKDELTKIEGIGPKIAEILNNNGIHSFRQLAAASVSDVKAALAKAGNRYVIHDPGTWGRQAQMAADGKWDELKKWQDELDGGK